MTLREVATRIAAYDPGTFDSEVAPDWVCFFCQTRQEYNWANDGGYVERHAEDCDLVALRQVLRRNPSGRVNQRKGSQPRVGSGRDRSEKE